MSDDIASEGSDPRSAKPCISSKETGESAPASGKSSESTDIKQSRIKPRHPSKNLEKLLSQCRWCVWQYAWDKKPRKWVKKPRSVKTCNWFKYGEGSWQRSIDKGHWGNFQQAYAAYERSQSLAPAKQMQGLGIVIESERPLYVASQIVHPLYVDLDNCRDPETGIIEQWALKIAYELPTYCEISPSGKGLRLIGHVTSPVSTMNVVYTLDGTSFIRETEIPDGDNKDNYRKVEIYGGGSGGHRLITITGCPLEDLMFDRDLPMADLTQWTRIMPGKEKVKERDKPIVPNPVEATDVEIHGRIQNSKDGPLMQRLFNGDTSLWLGDRAVYRSRSQADQGLFTRLAFYCQGDRELIEHIAKTTYMWREKWTDKYVGDCIDKGIAHCNKTIYYDPDVLRDKRHRAIERLFHLRMNHQWEGVNTRDLYLSFLAISYHRGRCEQYEGREGAAIDASARDLNLMSRLINPSISSNGRDLSAISKAWKELQSADKIKELNKGQGKNSSTYFIPFDFGLNEDRNNLSLASVYSTHGNPHTDTHRCVFSLSNVLNGYKDEEYNEWDGLYTELSTIEGIPKEDNLDGRAIPFYLKIIWCPTLSKNHRFLMEQILYGRSTLESLYDYFQPKRKDYFKKNQIGTLLDNGLIVQREVEDKNYYKVSVEGVERLFEESGRAELEKYLNFVEEERTVYRDSGEKANLIRSLEKVLSHFEGELAEDELSTSEKAQAIFHRNTSDPCGMLRQEIRQLSL